MMKSEFIERTGFEPTASEYEKIEEAYYQFDGDKDAFCKEFKESGGIAKLMYGRADEIERLRSQLIETEKMFRAESQKQEQRIAELEAELEREQEWKPCDQVGTNMSQKDYEDLASLCDGTHGDPHVMTDEEAAAVVAEEFGFDPRRIVIVDTVNTYEIDRHHRLRKAAEYTRRPLYDVSDYNYIRFNVKCGGATWTYEMVHGQLKEYSC